MTKLFQRYTSILFALAICLGISSSVFSQTEKEIMLYTEAMKSLKLLNRVKANEILTKVIASNPNYSAAQYQAGLIDLHFNRTEEAIVHFNKVVELKGDEYTDASVELSKIALKNGDEAKALELLNIIIENDNSNDKALAERGKIKLANKDIKGANSDLSTAILYNSSDYTYYYYRGITLIETEDYPNAISDFEKVIANIEEKPLLENAYFYRGYAYFQEGTDPKYHGHKALLHKALNDFNKCISLDKKDEAAFYNRGEVNMLLGHYIEAISDFKHSILINPNNYDAHYNKAICNYHFGEVKSAARELETLIKLNPDYADAYFQLGMWKYEMGSYSTSISLFDQLIKMEETPHSDAYLFRGYAHLDAKNLELACADWEMAESLGDKEAHVDIHKYCSKSKKEKK